MAVTIALMKTFEQGLPDNDWDTRQQPRGGHMLQGRPWAQFQLALGRSVVWAEGDGWSWLAIVTKGRGVSYLYAPYGPTARSATTFGDALASLKAAAVELGLDFVRCEPVGVPRAAVVKAGILPVHGVQPEDSLIIDLTQDEDALRKAISSGHRNAINGADRRGLEITLVRDSQNIATMLQLFHMTSEKRGFRTHADNYYQVMLETLMPLGAAMLGTATHDGQIVAAAIFLDYQGTRAYAHAGAAPEARKLQAAVPLVWAAAIDAKAAGFKKFDLWGIAPLDADENHPWTGFTRFKRAFGGEAIAYTGTWELPIKTMKYKLYRTAKRWLR